MRNELASAAAAAALMIISGSSSAHVATIDGCYDCVVYDTPSLIFHNTSGFDFTNAQMTLTGYQGLNNGLVQSTLLPNIVAGTDFTFTWLGSTTPGNLFAYDYDDEWGGGGACPPNPINSGLCNDVGNFVVTFTALWNGIPVFSQFSPHTNATGGFVGWEGLNPGGVSEDPLYDVHNGTVNGTLAFIDIGTPPPLPEPASLALVGTALAALAFTRRRKNGKS